MSKSDRKTCDKIAKLFETQDLDGFKKLVDGATDVNKAFDGMTILGYLTQIIADDETPGRERFFNYLIDKGANVNVGDNMGRTPLSNLAFSNNLYYLKLLLELGADVNYCPEEHGHRAIDQALRSNYSLECAKYLLALPQIQKSKADCERFTEVAKASGAKNSLALLKELGLR